MILEDILRRKILLLDGAMGTQLMSQGQRGVLELLNVENPDLVKAVHASYLDAGADIITTNTTCADALSLKTVGAESRSYELALAGAKLAREVADKYSTTLFPRYVAGSVGPTSRNLTLANDTTPEQVAAAYQEVIRGLIDGGVDMILVETAMDAKNVTIAIEECRKVDENIPILVSAVLSRIEGRVASGATFAKFFGDIPMERVSMVGFNCSNGVKPLESALKHLKEVTDKPVIVYPSAGEPRVAANHFAKAIEQLCRASQVNIIGGCCGTTSEYIAQLKRVAERWRPKRV
ncbi:MAG: homocysteine S-methyltransferase family protein [Alistipes sp.]|nr:homocysteine S-methyltransferase family protein [Alistipes sp.]